MGWGTETAPEALVENVAGAGDYMAAGVALNPRETIQFRVQRTDAVRTEPWGVEIYAALEDANYGSRPLVTKRYEATQLEATLLVTGPCVVTLRILNADVSPTDVVGGNVTYRKDGVSL